MQAEVDEPTVPAIEGDFICLTPQQVAAVLAVSQMPIHRILDFR